MLHILQAPHLATYENVFRKYSYMFLLLQLNYFQKSFYLNVRKTSFLAVQTVVVSIGVVSFPQLLFHSYPYIKMQLLQIDFHLDTE